MDVKMKSSQKRLNRILLMAGAMFVVSAGVLTKVYLDMNERTLESRFFPVFTDRTHLNWEQSETGAWSSETFLNKIRPCDYDKKQIETMVGYTPEGEFVESGVRYVDDPSPGSNRPLGWQRLDRRVEIVNPKVVGGSVMRGTIKHKCDPDNPEKTTITNYGPFVVGEPEVLPYYVDAWIQTGRQGRPSDYR